MKTHLIKIFWDNPYPKGTEYRIQSFNILSAPNKALRLWRTERKGERLKKVRLEAITL